MAGPEISVATTKAYSAQLAILYLLTLYLAQEKDVFSKGKISDCLKELELLPKNIEKILQNKEEIQHTAALHYNSKNVFFLGRNFDYAVAQEGALKLKEISYIHSEAYPAGELKHGAIALIENGSLVIALCGIEALYDFYPKEDGEGHEPMYLDLKGKKQGEVAAVFQYNYPIFTDDFRFRMDPENFEKLRSEYQYRREIYI